VFAGLGRNSRAAFTGGKHRPSNGRFLLLVSVAFALPICTRTARGDLSDASLEPVVVFHPILRIDRDRPTSTWRVKGLGPLVEWIHSRELSRLVLRPILRTERNYKTGEHRFDLLWPIVRRSWKRRPNENRADFETHVFPLYRYVDYTSPSGERRQSLVLFPFIYWGRQGDSGNYLIVFPFYWHASNARIALPIVWRSRRSFEALVPIFGWFHDLWGNDEVRFYGWPLLIRTRRGAERATWIFWPFLRFARGPDSWAARAWPLVGVKAKGGRLAEAFWLWPLGHYLRDDKKKVRHVMFLPFFWRMRSEKTKLDYYFPLFGRYESPSRRTTAYLWPIFIHSVGKKKPYDDFRFLWLVFRRKKAPEEDRFQIWPLFGRSIEKEHTSGFFLWPIMTASTDRLPRSQSVKRSFAPFYWFRKRAWSDGTERASWTFIPFGRYEKARDRTRRLRFFWPLWLGETEPVDTIYAPVWTVFDRRTVPGEYLHREVLGTTWLLHRDKSGETREVSLPLLCWRKSPRDNTFVLLGIVKLRFKKKRHAPGFARGGGR